ncbi:GNAT family N-acetyltransferase [Pullulanibacillus sp. KACC 23026]|uniref:GNAT family N-acetyltransferase n=1 Tax=Pullulanibacillus sp. KACC 23026 TaxID=3028315 RepID=UPI0023B1AFE4|nr:GNAT family N-acetyltransferase [Pullulanibacillus sp. KACC 23026]WEG12011.1 GNAT family N-acetyltransferase [Pullulanibacillus sp. KACC 23026]
MDLHKGVMTKNLAVEILNWQYEPPYDFYNNEVSDSAIRELIYGGYEVVLNSEDELVGFFCVGGPAQVFAGVLVGVYDEPCTDIGFGMRPDLTGQGNGTAFCSFIIADVKKKYKKKPLRLTVATFNTRAIHLYEKLGFKTYKHFKRDQDEFITMIQK